LERVFIALVIVASSLDTASCLPELGGTGAALLVAMFEERESPAVWLLGEHGMTHYDAVGFINRQALGEARYCVSPGRIGLPG
jgi:hypothetical protein